MFEYVRMYKYHLYKTMKCSQNSSAANLDDPHKDSHGRRLSSISAIANAANVFKKKKKEEDETALVFAFDELNHRAHKDGLDVS